MTNPAAQPESTLDHALAYGACGLRVLPIKPGTKRPPMNEWVEAATADLDLIRNWFTEKLYRDHGVGLAMGQQPNGRFIFALDIDEHDPAHSGSETLLDLIHEHGKLPETVRSLTGSRGLHLLYAVPVGRDGVVVRNGIAGDGIDVRGEGGQIVVAPTIHPATLLHYAWEDGYAPWEHPIADAPDWLLDLVTAAHTPAPAPAPPTPQTFASPETDSPAEWVRAQWSWPYQLGEAGWIEGHTDRRTGDAYWTRPGKDPREGESAVLHMPDGPFVIWSTDASMLVLRSVGRMNSDGSVSVSPFEFFAARRHGGDLSAAGRAIRALMDPQPAGPADRRLAPATRGATVTEIPHRRVRLTAASTILMRRTRWLWDERIPMGSLSLLAGPEGLGKSTLAYWLTARVTRGELAGEDWQQARSVLVCATEDSWSQTITPRLSAHGADLTRVFRIDVEVDGAIRAELSLPADLGEMEDVAADVNASLILLDPLMSRLDSRLDSHRDGEVRTALEPLVSSCERAALACLGVIHFNKSNSPTMLDQIMASKAFTAVARSVSTVIRDPDDDDVRLFGTIKNNLGRGDLPTRTFSFSSWTYPTVDDLGADDGMGSVGKLEWGLDSPSSIQSAARRAAEVGKANPVAWLREYMAKHGPRVASSDVYDAADEAEITRRSLQRARQKLGLDLEEAGSVGRGRTTYWFNPADSRLSPTTDTDDTIERPW
jgi:hypothetical protein